MPYKWVDPKVFVKWKGVTVYHTYRNDDANNAWFYHFTTNSAGAEGDDENSFDIRELPVVANPKNQTKCLSSNNLEHQKLIIKKCIEVKNIKLEPPDGWPT